MQIKLKWFFTKIDILTLYSTDDSKVQYADIRDQPIE